MSNTSDSAFPPLWRALGLSVALGYAGLGSYAAFFPIQCASTYGLRSPISATTTAGTDKYTKTAMLWIGARDISIAAALLAFYYENKPREMGTLILAGMGLCVTDSVCVWRFRQDALGASVGFGAAVWGWIGWQLRML